VSHAVWRLVFFDIIIKLKYRESGGSFNMKHICLPDIPEDLASKIYNYRVNKADEEYEISIWLMILSSLGILSLFGLAAEALNLLSVLEQAMSLGLILPLIALSSFGLYRSFGIFFSYARSREICLSVLAVYPNLILKIGGSSHGFSFRRRPLPSVSLLFLFWTCVELGGFLLAMFKLSVFKADAINAMVPLSCLYMGGVFALINYTIFRWIRTKARGSVNKGEIFLTEDPEEPDVTDEQNFPDLPEEIAEELYIFHVEKANDSLSFSEKSMTRGILFLLPLVAISFIIELKSESLSFYEMVMAFGLAIPLAGLVVYNACTAFVSYAAYLKSEAVATLIDALNWGVSEDNFGSFSRVRVSYPSSAVFFKLSWGVLLSICSLPIQILLRSSLDEASRLLAVLSTIYAVIGIFAFSFFLFRFIKWWATKKIGEKEIYTADFIDHFTDNPSAINEQE